MPLLRVAVPPREPSIHGNNSARTIQDFSRISTIVLPLCRFEITLVSNVLRRGLGVRPLAFPRAERTSRASHHGRFSSAIRSNWTLGQFLAFRSGRQSGATSKTTRSFAIGGRTGKARHAMFMLGTVLSLRTLRPLPRQMRFLTQRTLRSQRFGESRAQTILAERFWFSDARIRAGRRWSSKSPHRLLLRVTRRRTSALRRGVKFSCRSSITARQFLAQCLRL